MVLFQCKAFANESGSEQREAPVRRRTAAITFQNGLGNEQALGGILGRENVIGGLTAQAGLAEGPGVVRNFGDLPTHIGEMAGGLSDRTVAIAKAFTAHGLPVNATPRSSARNGRSCSAMWRSARFRR